MKIAFVIYNELTLLDFAGAYDPLTRLKTMGFVPDLTYDICARTATVRSAEGAELVPARVDNDLSGYDYVIVPGGDGIKSLMRDPAFLRWISVASDRTTVAAVCGTGGLPRTRPCTGAEEFCPRGLHGQDRGRGRHHHRGRGNRSDRSRVISLRKDRRAWRAGTDTEADGLSRVSPHVKVRPRSSRVSFFPGTPSRSPRGTACGESSSGILILGWTILC